jgi:hypothetical protein
VKWAIVAVVVILAAPTIANRLTPADSHGRAASASRQRGLLYRAVRRYGLRRVAVAVLVLLVALVVLVYLLVRAA